MLKRLGSIPYWRSSKNFIRTMESTDSQTSFLAEKMIDIQASEQEKIASKSLD